MPPRNPSLPEGTDQIIDTNIDVGGSDGLSATGGGAGTGAGAGTTGMGTSGSGATGTGTTSMTDTTSGSGASGSDSAFQFNEGRDSGQGGDSGSKSSVSKAADTIVNQLKDQVGTLRSTAGDRARSYAVDGKRQATELLGTVAQVIQDAAGSVETRLGPQYAGFGNRAVEQVNSLARTLDGKEVDELFDDARSFVKRSPAMAIGIAAVVGFAVARVVRSGVEELSSNSPTTGSGGDTQPAAAIGTTAGNAGSPGAGGTGGMGAGATGGLTATSGGFGEQGVGTAGTIGSTGSSNGTGSSAPKY